MASGEYFTPELCILLINKILEENNQDVINTICANLQRPDIQAAANELLNGGDLSIDSLTDELNMPDLPDSVLASVFPN